MKPVSQDKSHCFKHACTYPRSEGMCPYCKLARATLRGNIVIPAPFQNAGGELVEDEQQFETGDIVAGDTQRTLHCGSGWYDAAIVVSARPLVLVSREGDMLWCSTVADLKLHRIGRADKAQLRVCMERFLNDYEP